MSKFLKVEQLDNKKQFVVDDEKNGVRYFQSYNSLIAKYERATHKLTLGCNWDYSNTTRKHLYIFIERYCYIAQLDVMLQNAKSKRQAIYKAIKSKLIRYCESMQ